VEPLLSAAQARLDSTEIESLRRILAALPGRLRARTAIRSGFSLVHGDPNPTNILSPRHPPGKIFLIDRQPFDWSLTTWLGVHDLAYLMVLFWETPIRRTQEIPILTRYLEQLTQRGVAGYAWEDLFQDYRLSAAQCACVPVSWCVRYEDRVRKEWLWSRQLQRVLTACQDLNIERGD
jgi:hypothetical protein